MAGDQADPDGDGLSNLWEFLLGADPRLATSASAHPVFSLEDNHLTVTVHRSPLAVGVSLEALVSGDLNDWQSGHGHTTLVLDTPEQVKIHDNASAATAGQRFMRLKLVRP